MDNFIQIIVFCPAEPRVGAFVYRNEGKGLLVAILVALSPVPSGSHQYACVP